MNKLKTLWSKRITWATSLAYWKVLLLTQNRDIMDSISMDRRHFFDALNGECDRDYMEFLKDFASRGSLHYLRHYLRLTRYMNYE